MKTKIQMGNERGQALVEFAVVVPIFLFLLLAILQFGIIFNNYVTLTDAVRAGSRVAVVSRHESCPSCEAETAVEAAASGLDADKLGVEVAVSPAWETGAQVTVTGTYPYEINILGKVVASGDLTTEIKERVE